MNNFFVVAICLALSLLSSVSGAHPSHHVKHNMVLLGEAEVFASHIVYKVPHNYQVILKVNFNDVAKTAYLQERKTYPQDQFIFLLDETDIKDIASLSSISGALIRVDSQGKRIHFLDGVILKSGSFSVLFFNELPLSLE